MKQDLRVVKTKRALKNSLLELLKVKTFEKITVSDICKTAMINRVTFYSHYQDKYDLFLDYINDISLRINENALNGLKGQTRQERIIEFCLNSFNCALDEIVQYREVLMQFGYQENSMLVYILQKNTIQDLKKILEEICLDRPAKFPVQSIASFIVGGMSQLLSDCLETKQVQEIETFRRYGLRLIESLLRKEVLFY